MHLCRFKMALSTFRCLIRCLKIKKTRKMHSCFNNIFYFYQIKYTEAVPVSLSFINIVLDTRSKCFTDSHSYNWIFPYFCTMSSRSLLPVNRFNLKNFQRILSNVVCLLTWPLGPDCSWKALSSVDLTGTLSFCEAVKLRFGLRRNVSPFYERQNCCIRSEFLSRSRSRAA